MQARYQAEVEQAQAAAGQAGPLAQAQAQQEVIAAQTELAQREAELRQRQLLAEVVKPAEAEAEKVRVMAKADAERMRIQAEAAASHDRVALDRMLIDQLPLIVREAARGLSGANVNILNGAEGISELAASLVGQGVTIFESLRKNISAAEPAGATRGRRMGGRSSTRVRCRGPSRTTGVHSCCQARPLYSGWAPGTCSERYFFLGVPLAKMESPGGARRPVRLRTRSKARWEDP